MHFDAAALSQVMEVYQEMLRTGCERSVITYSALISACEKAGQWQLALNLFSEMLQERCVPNVITYNSLITACAQVRMRYTLATLSWYGACPCKPCCIACKKVVGICLSQS
jgi:pentatricopeptide repeat protein